MVKNGIASSNSFDKMPKIFSGKLDMKAVGNHPIQIANRPQPNPKAEIEKATGKPMSMINTRPANITGAKFSITITKSLRSCSYSSRYCNGFS